MYSPVTYSDILRGRNARLLMVTWHRLLGLEETIYIKTFKNYRSDKKYQQLLSNIELIKEYHRFRDYCSNG